MVPLLSQLMDTQHMKAVTDVSYNDVIYRVYFACFKFLDTPRV